jgi:hypothetical protein
MRKGRPVTGTRKRERERERKRNTRHARERERKRKRIRAGGYSERSSKKWRWSKKQKVEKDDQKIGWTSTENICHLSLPSHLSLSPFLTLSSPLSPPFIKSDLAFPPPPPPNAPLPPPTPSMPDEHTQAVLPQIHYHHHLTFSITLLRPLPSLRFISSSLPRRGTSRLASSLPTFSNQKQHYNRSSCHPNQNQSHMKKNHVSVVSYLRSLQL